ncbi:hypothetical protein GQ600_19121 [Phytophthora cactorum]|nr:hypothetical protein GQ600_19121 [Phytophthora cactorum]
MATRVRELMKEFEKPSRSGKYLAHQSRFQAARHPHCRLHRAHQSSPANRELGGVPLKLRFTRTSTVELGIPRLGSLFCYAYIPAGRDLGQIGGAASDQPSSPNGSDALSCGGAAVDERDERAIGEDRESGQHRPTREEVQEASSAGNNLRVLPDDVAGKDGEVRSPFWTKARPLFGREFTPFRIQGA